MGSDWIYLGNINDKVHESNRAWMYDETLYEGRGLTVFDVIEKLKTLDQTKRVYTVSYATKSLSDRLDIREMTEKVVIGGI